MRLEVSQGHQIIPYVRYGFLLVCYSNFVRKSHCFFLDIRLQIKNAVTLKIGLRVRQGHWKFTIRYSAYDFLLTFYSKYGCISSCYSFLIYATSKMS